MVALLKAPEHGCGDKLTDADVIDPANFVRHGQIDGTKDVADKASTGDATAGKQVFVTACIGCRGAEGKLPKEMPTLGSLSGSPWEVMHKILNGQPGEVMPALRAVGPQISANLVAYLATLPAE